VEYYSTILVMNISNRGDQGLTNQSSGRRFRIWHFRSFNVSRYVSANLFKVVLLNNIVANCAYDES
jgi:hypothetical protein